MFVDSMFDQTTFWGCIVTWPYSLGTPTGNIDFSTALLGQGNGM